MQNKWSIRQKANAESSERTVGIESLRVMAMLMIITIHYWGGGRAVPEFSGDWIPLWLVEGFCAGAVNIFALISGYVMYGKKRSLSKVISLWLEVLIISIFGLVLQVVFAFDTVSGKCIVQSFFPFLSGRHWYFSAYIVLFLFIPFLNAVIENASWQQASIRILILVGVFSIAPTVSIFIGDPNIYGLNAGFSVNWLAGLYLVGAYIKKFKNNLIISKLLNNRFLCIMLAMLCGLVILTILLIVALFQDDFPLISILWSPAYYRYFTPLVMAQSILIFCSCVDLKPRCEPVNRVFRWMGPLTFGIYIVHVLPVFEVIILPYLKQWQARNEWLGLIISALDIILIFLGCTLVSFAFYKIFGGTIRKTTQWIQKTIKDLCDIQNRKNKKYQYQMRIGEDIRN